MKLLFVAATFPYPLDSGSANLIFHWLKAATQEHVVDLIIVGSTECDRRHIPGLDRVRVEVVTPIIGRSIRARLTRFLSSVGSGIPATSLVVMGERERAVVLTRALDPTYDAVVLAENCVACYAPLIASKAPVLLLKHSVQAVDARDERARVGWWNLKQLLHQWVVVRQERRTCRSADSVCCVNHEDARELTSRYGVPKSLNVVPIGVELSHFMARNFDPGNHTIVFFGNMTWGANVDAVNWFVEKVLPLIWRQSPKVQFRIIGQGGQDLTVRRADPRIQRVGRVPDIPEALRDVTVGVVPIISGTGIRFKLLELLAMGIPTVTTSLGLAGTGFAGGKQCLVGDSPNAFADAVLLLLSNGRLRARLNEAGKESVASMEWSCISPKIMNALAETVNRPRTSVKNAEQ